MLAQDADLGRVGECFFQPEGKPIGHRIAEHHDLRGRRDVGAPRRGRARGIGGRLALLIPEAERIERLVRLLLILLVAPPTVFQERKPVVEHCAAAGGIRARIAIAAAAASARPNSAKPVHRAKPSTGILGLSTAPEWSPGRTIGHQRPENVNLKILAGFPSLSAAQPLQNRHGCEPVRHEAAAGLEIAHGGAGLEPEAARSARRRRTRAAQDAAAIPAARRG